MNTAVSIRNALILLRFPFSLFLLPVSLFSILFITIEAHGEIVLMLCIWHLLVFPSSNGYNGFHDRDQGPVGGLEAPPMPSAMLLHFCNVMDILALLFSVLISIQFLFFTTVYIIASRLYSNRKIRLKKYPLAAFLIVFIFQGAWIFVGNITGIGNGNELSGPAIYGAIASSFFIGSLYPITQIYQHKEDEADGVLSMSMLLGKKNTFVFSGFMFIVASLFIYLTFKYSSGSYNFLLFNIVMLPSVTFFLIWAIKSFKNPANVNFRNTMIMVILSSCLINIYFLILLIR